MTAKLQFSDICSDIYADFWIEVISMANDPECKLSLNNLLQVAVCDTLAKHQAKQPCIS